MTSEKTHNPSSKAQQPSIPMRYHISLISASVIIGLICLVSVIAVSFFGASNRNAITLDQRRLEDFSGIKANIEYYYRNSGSILAHDLNFYGIYLTDPETKKPYDYKRLSNYSYQLCTTFSTQENNNTNHKKGYDCITYKIPESYRRDRNSKPIYKPLTFTKPASGETLCLGQPYTIEWETDSDTAWLHPYLYTFDRKTYFFYPYQDQDLALNPGKPADPNNPNSKLKGSYVWKVVGEITDSDISKDLSVKKITNPGSYIIGATVSTKTADGFSSSLSNQSITISDCAISPTPTLTFKVSE